MMSLLASLLAATGLLTTTVCGWIPLFDGQTLQGWQTPSGQAPAPGWSVSDTAIHLDPAAGRPGPILTERSFTDFELVFEWKIAPGGNSGIKYRVRDYDGRVLGLEYQMIDDAAHRRLRPTQLSAALYDLYEPSERRELKPAGQFNRGRIVVCGNRIEHWLNGRRVVCAVVGSTEWRERIARSKFANVPGFGTNRTGRIMLTDHNSAVSFRNIFVRPL